MAAESLHEAVWDWLQECPYIYDLFFDMGYTKNGNTTMIPNESLKAEYIDGAKEYYYDCNLIRYMPLSDIANDLTNIANAVDFDMVAKWIDEQFKEGNLPQVPEGLGINNIEMQPNSSGFAVSEDNTTGRYTLQFRIEYFRS